MKTNQIQKKEIITQFSKMNSKSDFLSLLNYTKFLIYGDKIFPFTEKQLNFYINASNYKDNKTYTSFEIKKKSGKTRTIHAPNKGLKELQKCLNIILSLVYTPHTSAFGFVKGKSIIDNAKKHTNKNYVYNIDLKDFFPSIDASRVWARFKYPPFNLGTNKNREQIANMIKAICCTPMLVEREVDGIWANKITSVLPQGAATSPILTNAICERLDIRLTGLSKRFGLEYSRYADDITFSSMHNTYATEKGIQESIYKTESTFDRELRRIISSQNFRVNEKKVRLQKRGYKQEVTGLIVNEKVNTPNFYVKEIRQWIYFWESKGYDKAYELFLKKYLKNKGIVTNSKPNMHMVIEGKLLYLKMVKGETNTTYLKLKSRFDKLVNNKNNVPKPNYIIEENKIINNVAEKKQSYNKNMNVIIQTILKDGLEKAMSLYKSE
ncbi:reverse transcriptase domain-containing protein [uncultured Lacinutrix sp.]|uniref:reverse transcriptase domain-containing protein n=1 Tax=uncultured Lacinutrix sp. TaxID=574032 RepID=UPI002636AC51|nr:reverse transcriptase domain-containing protein [uncultured Lacinutrix sp.]